MSFSSKLTKLYTFINVLFDVKNTVPGSFRYLELLQVVKMYGLGDIHSVKLLSGGLGQGNSSSDIDQPLLFHTSKGKFVVKKSPHSQDIALETLKSQVLLFNHLRKNNFLGVPTIYSTKSGSYSFVKENKLAIYYITSFAEGSLPEKVNRPILLKSVANFLAEYHNSVRKFKPIKTTNSSFDVVNTMKNDFKFLLFKSQKDSSRLGLFLQKNLGYIISKCDDLQTDFHNLKKSNLLKLQTHGDYHWKNILVNNETPVGLIDFELTKYDYRITDFVNGITPIDYSIMFSFLIGYQERAVKLGIGLNKDELVMLKLIYIRKLLGILHWLSSDQTYTNTNINGEESFYENQFWAMKNIRKMDWDTLIEKILAIK